MGHSLNANPSPRFRIAVDTGGTFTDVVVSSSDGRLFVGKALTTYGRVFDGFRDSVDRAARTVGLTASDVLSAADVIVYGTTHATNAVLTGRVAKTAMLVTEGFADTLLLREGGRRNVFDSRAPYPPPYIPRRLTFELKERVTAEGEIHTALDEARAREVISGLAELGVQAVAVMLLWSVANDAHERRVGELIEELLPGVAYTLSVEANPSLREYRRASAAAIDASLKSLMSDHLGGLREDLRRAEFSGDLMVVTSEGAVLDVDDVIARPVLTINSGPSMAPLAGASAAPDAETVVVADMGGTTFDVSLVERGRVRHTREAWLGEPFVGHLTGLSSVAVQSIGAGGGSIAWIDPGGMLRVGPQSARSEPGPAAYGRGGELPTVTDACVALGYLNADTFEAGFRLDKAAAERAIDTHVGSKLGMSTVQAAQAILDVSANHMASAIRQVTLEHGVDPRGALLVAGGGAGAMVAAAIADLLEADEVVIPATAGVLAAYGAHEAPIATDFTYPYYAETDNFDVDRVNSVLEVLETRAATFTSRFAAPGIETRRSYFVDARYPAQAWDLRVYLNEMPQDRHEAAKAIAQAFHDEHRYRNGTEDATSRVEILNWGVRAEIGREGFHAPSLTAIDTGTNVREGEAVFSSRPVSTPRHVGSSLKAGDEVHGPAIIDTSITTIVIPPRWQALLDSQRNVRLRRQES